MVWSFRNWRRRRVQQHNALPEPAWRDVVASLLLLEGLSGDELKRLRELVTVFLHEKELVAARGYVLSGEMRLKIAAQACLPILNLGLDYYAGWVSSSSIRTNSCRNTNSWMKTGWCIRCGNR